jgi:chromosome partitioning protein
VSSVGTSRTVAIVNQKGGVGKTTTTLGLASAAREAGRRVLVVDLDPQASSTWILGVDPDEVDMSVADVLDGRSARSAIVPSAWGDEIDVLPSTRTLQASETGRSTTALRRALVTIQDSADPYDAILIDCPPALGSITESGLSAARHALIVVEPSALGLRGVEAVADTIDHVWEKQNPDLEVAGVLVNRVPAVSSEAERQLDILNRTVGRRSVWEPYVPQRVILSEAVSQRRAIHDMGARATDVCDIFDALWRRLWRRIKSA